jgi:hypothetical protein
VRDSTLCRPGLSGQKCPSPAVHLVLLLGWLGGACGSDRRPGILIEVTVENPDFRPQVVQFDWMAPGQQVLVQGELTPYSRPSDPTFFGSLFIETRGRLEESRVIALQGRLNDGEVVSGTYAVIPPDIESFRSYAILLGAPLPDGDGNGTPDIIDRCTSPGADVGCAAGVPDGGAPPPDASLEDGPAPSPDAPPDSPERDAGAEAGMDVGGDAPAGDAPADSTAG